MKELICIVCPRGCHLTVDENNGYAVTGNSCKRGEIYGKAEVTNPVRVVTSTVAVVRMGGAGRAAVNDPAGAAAARCSAADGRAAVTSAAEARELDTRCPVKTSDAIPKALIFDAMKEIEAASVTAPVHIGDVVIPHICGTEADLVACKDIA